MIDISQKLIETTIKNSYFEKKRDYVSMSNASLSVDELISQYFNGFEYSENIALKCYKGYQMESDLRTRIMSCFHEECLLGYELKAFDGIVKGHPDLWIFNMPGDIKSVLMDEWMPKNGKLPKKVYWQMQAYMLFSNRNQSVVVYESRETGLINHFYLRENKIVQKEIYDKFETVVKTIKNNNQ